MEERLKVYDRDISIVPYRLFICIYHIICIYHLGLCALRC